MTSESWRQVPMGGKVWAELAIDPACEARRIESFLRKQVRRLGKRGVVVGLSGGLDSSTCAYLCVRTLGRKRVHGLVLPERDSDPGNRAHAHMVAQQLGIRCQQRDLTPLLREIGIYRLVSPGLAGNRGLLETGIRWLVRLTRRTCAFSWAMGVYYNYRPGWLGRLVRCFLPGVLGSAFTFALTKPRLRMLILYDAAARHNSLVVGTLDRTEWTMGFYEPYGDGASDVQLLVHLYKTQIRQLARHLGVPAEIVDKPSSGDLAAGLPNEALLGLTYDQLDCALQGLHHCVARRDIRAQAGLSGRAMRDICQAIELAELRRSLPAHLPHGGEREDCR
jgi:NAD+ synthase